MKTIEIKTSRVRRFCTKVLKENPSAEEEEIVTKILELLGKDESRREERDGPYVVTVEFLGNTLDITHFMRHGGLELHIDDKAKVRFNDKHNNIQIVKSAINGHDQINVEEAINEANKKKANDQP